MKGLKGMHSIFILNAIYSGNSSWKQIKQNTNDLNSFILSDNLKKLEKEGLVVKKNKSYSITENGKIFLADTSKSLSKSIDSLSLKVHKIYERFKK